MIRLEFHFAARAELREAFEYFEKKGSGLGGALLGEVSKVTDRILRYPLSAPRVGRNTRTAPVKNFPYQIVYRLKDGLLEVIAVMHNRRQPDYWKGRL